MALTLAFIGAGDGLNLALAWTYVVLRVLHSLVHALLNIVIWRFSVFMLGSVVLLVLATRAAVLVF